MEKDSDIIHYSTGHMSLCHGFMIITFSPELFQRDSSIRNSFIMLIMGNSLHHRTEPTKSMKG